MYVIKRYNKDGVFQVAYSGILTNYSVALECKNFLKPIDYGDTFAIYHITFNCDGLIEENKEDLKGGNESP